LYLLRLARCALVRKLAQNQIGLQQSLGKVRLPADFSERLAPEAFESLPLMASQTRQVSLLPWSHRDPFDRMLLAQAQLGKLVLLTADEALAAYGAVVHLAR
jgi:PIN domain nuclease of toxin-antitoxin system